MNVRHLTAVAAVAFVGLAAPAGAATIFTGSGGGGSVTVSTLNATTLQVVLTDSNSIVSDATALSGVQLFLSSAPTSVVLNEVTNTFISFASKSDGSFTPSLGTPDHWGVGLSGTTLTLETVGPVAVGGMPDDLIIDAPTSPATLVGNPANFNPYIQDTGTFDLVLPSTYIAALTTGSITGAAFQFSTTAGFTTGVPTGVPEPSTWAMFLLGFGAIGWTLRGRRNAAAATA